MLLEHAATHAIPTDKTMKHALEISELLVHALHPASEGWHEVHIGKHREEDLQADMFMYKKGQPPVGIIYMNTPYVTGSDLKMATQLKTLMVNFLNGRDACVMLVYRALVVRPQKVPKGIYIISITEGTATQQGPN